MVKIACFTFVAYLVILQLFLLYVHIQAKFNNDHTPIELKNPLLSILQSQLEGSTTTTWWRIWLLPSCRPYPPSWSTTSNRPVQCRIVWLSTFCLFGSCTSNWSRNTQRFNCHGVQSTLSNLCAGSQSRTSLSKFSHEADAGCVGSTRGTTAGATGCRISRKGWDRRGREWWEGGRWNSN